MLPGYQRVTDPDVRARFNQAWHAEVPARPGLRILDMFASAKGAGRVHPDRECQVNG